MGEQPASHVRTHLHKALELARLGRGRVSPNPLVGCVIERGDEVLAEGYHAELGGLHAESAALASCGERGIDPAGSTMYVTLEPCAHHGRQPPCAEAIVEAGVARVVIAAPDPTPKASGSGPGILERAGVAVEWAPEDVAREARLQNQPFRKHARTGRPHVRYKAAASLDGRTATAAGDSRWISSEPSRALVHEWRAEADAIAVGVGTALADDPMLTARRADGEPRDDELQPLRVVFDSDARLPAGSQLARTAERWPVLLVCSQEAPQAQRRELEAAGVELLALAGEPEQRLGKALDELAGRDVRSLLLEGGAELAGAFLEAGEIDELSLFLAPVLIGGDGAPPLIGGRGARRIDSALKAADLSAEPSGDDLLVSARIAEW